MTIVEAVNKLLEHYAKKDSFSMEEDYLNIMELSENPDQNKMSFSLALEDLEKNDIVKSYCNGKKKTYILKKSLNSFEQNVTIAGFTSLMIAKIINDFCDKIKDKRDYCDSRQINEKDIRNLIFIASMNVNQDKDNQNTLD